MEHYEALWSNIEHCGALWTFMDLYELSGTELNLKKKLPFWKEMQTMILKNLCLQ